MAAQHFAKWRQKDGRLSALNDHDAAPSALLREIGKNSTVSSRGIQFPFGNDEYWDVIACSIAVVDASGDPLPDEESAGLVKQALTDEVRRLGGGRSLEPAGLLRRVNQVAKEYFAKPPTRFAVVTSLSTSGFPREKLESEGWSVEAIKARKHYPWPDNLVLHNPSGPLASYKKQSNYTLLKLTGYSRSAGAAVAQSTVALDCLRGLWSLAVKNPVRSTIWVGVQTEPLGIIFPGPLRTVHHPEGEPYTSEVYYDPRLPREYETYPQKKDATTFLSQLEASRQRMLRRLRAGFTESARESAAAHRYRRDVLSLVARYARAMDNVDIDVGALQLWAILERITNTIGKNYDATVKRATWAYSDGALSKQYLSYIRSRRNQYVHSGKSWENAEKAVLTLSGYVRAHLWNLVYNRLRVSSVEEYAEILSLPATERGLEQLASKVARAQRVVND